MNRNKAPNWKVKPEVKDLKIYFLGIKKMMTITSLNKKLVDKKNYYLTIKCVK